MCGLYLTSKKAVKEDAEEASRSFGRRGNMRSVDRFVVHGDLIVS